MHIKCPECLFSREIPDETLPSRAQLATCPKCGHKFQFRELPPPSIFDAAKSLSPAQAETGQAETGQAESGEAQPPRPGSPGIWERLQDRPGPVEAPAQETSPETPAPDQAPEQNRPEFQDHGWIRAMEAEDTALPPVEPPFERLEDFGFFPGLWQTIRRVLTSPRLFFQAMPLNRGIMKPLIFYLLLSEFQAVTEFLWGLAGFTGMSGLGDAPVDGAAGPVMMGLSSMAMLVLYPLLLSGLLFAAAGLNHLFLSAVKAAQGGFEATFRAMAYSSAPFILCLVPVLGPMAAAFWSMTLSFIGYKYLHRTTYSRVLLASAIPLVLIMVLALVLLRSKTPTI